MLTKLLAYSPRLFSRTSQQGDNGGILKKKQVYAAQVLKHVENRNEFLADLSAVLADSPMPVGATVMLRLGEITDIEILENTATAIVEVDSARLSDDPSVMNVMPPTPIRFEMVGNGAWKYAGVDEVKQREIAERHMDLWAREFVPADDDDPSADMHIPQVQQENGIGEVLLTANWVPLDDESTYGLHAKKWPEINQMKPVAEQKSYDHAFFHSMIPKPDTSVGDTWKIDENALLPLLQQFHIGASCKLHHGGANWRSRLSGWEKGGIAQYLDSPSRGNSP